LGVLPKKALQFAADTPGPPTASLRVQDHRNTSIPSHGSVGPARSAPVRVILGLWRLCAFVHGLCPLRGALTGSIPGREHQPLVRGIGLP